MYCHWEALRLLGWEVAAIIVGPAMRSHDWCYLLEHSLKLLSCMAEVTWSWQQSAASVYGASFNARLGLGAYLPPPPPSLPAPASPPTYLPTPKPYLWGLLSRVYVLCPGRPYWGTLGFSTRTRLQTRPCPSRTLGSLTAPTPSCRTEGPSITLV